MKTEMFLKELKIYLLRVVICSLFLFPFSFFLSNAQVPRGFNYQAIARGADGKEILNTPIQVKLSILSDTTGFYKSGTGNYIWEELHSVTTNSQGLFTLVLGNPLATRVQGVDAFTDIDWRQVPLYIGTKVFKDTWHIMGASKILSVPYSTLTGNLAGPVDKLVVEGKTTLLDDALFEVKNRDGRTVFAVYNEGVRIYVDDGLPGKGLKGGFAIGGFDKAKGTIQNYMLVKPDTIRLYVDDTPGKALKGGFAIGGFDKTKGVPSEYLGVKPSTPEIINPAEARILWYPLKEAFLTGRVKVVSPDSVGFNSFASGFESQAIGNWSQAQGFRAIARGHYSTSIGYNSIAQKNNSYAFGRGAVASGLDSYAFGTSAKATGPQSFAIGSVGVDSTGAPTGSTISSGWGSFAAGFGSVASGQGAFTLGVSDTAAGWYSTAMGLWTSATGPFSTTMGVATKARGWVSTAAGVLSEVPDSGVAAMAFGLGTRANNWAAIALGDSTNACGHTSFATGYKTKASGQLSSTFGCGTTASGYGASAFGFGTKAQSLLSVVIGSYNTVSGSENFWYPWDPAFVIGNGLTSSARSNAMTVYKSGAADLASSLNLNASVSSGKALFVNGKEALWFNGTAFSWGYDGTYNVFANKVSVGTTASPGSYTLWVEGSAWALGTWGGSDIRWKKDIQPLRPVIKAIADLNCYTFDWRKDEFPELHFDDSRQIGLIAQDVEKAFPELVRTDGNGFKAVAYDKLTVVLLKGIKEQQEQINNIEKENVLLKSELSQIKEELARIKETIQK